MPARLASAGERDLPSSIIRQSTYIIEAFQASGKYYFVFFISFVGLEV
jgi:hypothetical protein